MKKSKSSQLVVQGSILAIASLIVRLIGLVYRIPLVNILGDEGSGYYGNAYALYTYLLIVSSYGFPAAISKLVSARLTVKKDKEAHKIFISAIFLSMLLGLIFSLVLYFGADAYAVFTEMPNSAPAIRALAPALFIFSMLAVFRGYFQGMNTMVPTAISQVIEQIFNAVFSLIFAMTMLTTSVAYGAAGSSLGTGTGALAALIFIVILYIVYRPKLLARIQEDSHSLKEKNIFSFWQLILMTSVPMVIGTSTFHLTNLVDNIMFNKALAFHLYDELQISTLMGILEGKYKILITLPVSIASAVATASIPSITASLVRKDHHMMSKKIDMAIRSVLIITIPACAGIMVLAGPILELLFTNLTHIKMTTALLQIGAISIIFFGLSTISIGILQGLDKLKLPVRNSFISLIIKVIFNILFLYVFNFNIYGAVITNIIFAITSASLNLYSVNKYVPLKLEPYKTIMAPLMASLIMAGVCIAGFEGLNLKLSSDISLLIILPIAILVYGSALLMLKGFDEDELDALPMGRYISRFIRR